MAKQTINIGAAAGDKTGDKLRAGGDKINDNFNEIYGYEEMGAVFSTPPTKAEITSALGITPEQAGVGWMKFIQYDTGSPKVTNYAVIRSNGHEWILFNGTFLG